MLVLLVGDSIVLKVLDLQFLLLRVRVIGGGFINLDRGGLLHRLRLCDLNRGLQSGHLLLDLGFHTTRLQERDLQALCLARCDERDLLGTAERKPPVTLRVRGERDATAGGTETLGFCESLCEGGKTARDPLTSLGVDRMLLEVAVEGTGPALGEIHVRLLRRVEGALVRDLLHDSMLGVVGFDSLLVGILLDLGSVVVGSLVVVAHLLPHLAEALGNGGNGDLGVVVLIALALELCLHCRAVIIAPQEEGALATLGATGVALLLGPLATLGLGRSSLRELRHLLGVGGKASLELRNGDLEVSATVLSILSLERADGSLKEFHGSRHSVDVCVFAVGFCAVDAL